MIHAHVDLDWSQNDVSNFKQIQIDICQSRADGIILKDIMAKYNINKSTIYSIINQTLLGNIWGENKGGQTGFLGEIDTQELILKVKEKCKELNCLRTVDVLQIAVDLRYKRYQRAVFLIKKLKSEDHPGHNFEDIRIRLIPYVPSTSWVHDFAERNDIPIKTPATLEELRRKFCNCNNIRDFYIKNQADFTSTHPRLIWNADEASHTSSRQFKALAGSLLDRCVVSQTGPEPHFTTMYAFNAGGEKMQPFIILPNIISLPGSLNLDFQAILATQNSGWMTSHLFSVWCVYFASKVSQIRMELPNAYRNQRCILIVDNHPSRMNTKAIEFLLSHNIKIVTLPAHCSHVLQPFDVAVAASVKAKITRARLIDFPPRFFWEYNSKIMKVRYSIVHAIVTSWEEVSRDILLKGWEKSGIFPFNMNKGLQNTLTNQVIIPNNQTNVFSISNKDLSLPINRLQIAQKKYGVITVPNIFSIPKPTYNDMFTQLKFSFDLHQGILNSKLPNIYVEQSLNKWIRVFGE